MNKLFKLFLSFLFLFNLSQPIFSHGTVIWPPSRIYNCYNSPSTAVCQPCGDAIYNWMGVLQPDTDFGKHQEYVPDGQIASGGNGGGIDFSCLDGLTTAWPTTRVNHGYIDVKWQNTAPHKTEYYKVYITPLNWNPTTPLRWNDLIEIGHVGKRPAQSFTTIRSFIPDSYANKRAALVSVWQRDYNDSHEAFYSVSDILVYGNGGGCTTGDMVDVTFTNNTNCALEYFQNNVLQGFANAGDFYVANTTIGSQWQAQDSSGNQVSNFTITCEQIAYTSIENCNDTGGNGCNSLNNWFASTIYVGGTKVKYNGVEYEAKWWTKGDNPQENSGTYQVWKNMGICTNEFRNGHDPIESFMIKSISYRFRNTSTVNYRVNVPKKLTMSIRNLSNQTVVKMFENQIKEPGEYTQSFNPKSLPPGIYLCVLEDNNGILKSFKISVR